eukprot:gene25055-biopygen4465
MQKEIQKKVIAFLLPCEGCIPTAQGGPDRRRRCPARAGRCPDRPVSCAGMTAQRGVPTARGGVPTAEVCRPPGVPLPSREVR